MRGVGGLTPKLSDGRALRRQPKALDLDRLLDLTHLKLPRAGRWSLLLGATQV
jgi:hypothetical protein